MMKNLIYLVAGARPNFIKIAPLIQELKRKNIHYKFIHTGQHYDYNMSKIFFNDLGIPEPDIHLNIGSASHATQTAKIMMKFEEFVLKDKPSLVIVVGDVNSTFACALVAKKIIIKVAHVEAGLRSFDRRMPEEINRILTDQISDFLFTTEKNAEINLKREGIDSSKIFFVGNVMIDTLIMNIEKAKKLFYYKKFNLKKDSYALITIHRPSNVDLKEDLFNVVEIINYVQDKMDVVFPIHPRTKKNLIKHDLINKLSKKNMTLIEPKGYLEFLNLMQNAKLILTDSGGIQEEASYLKIPVLTLRKNTERPITIENGTNTLIGGDFNKLKINIDRILNQSYKKGLDIEKWDGKTSQRIVGIIEDEFFKSEIK